MWGKDGALQAPRTLPPAVSGPVSSEPGGAVSSEPGPVREANGVRAPANRRLPATQDLPSDSRRPRSRRRSRSEWGTSARESAPAGDAKACRSSERVQGASVSRSLICFVAGGASDERVLDMVDRGGGVGRRGTAYRDFLPVSGRYRACFWWRSRVVRC